MRHANVSRHVRELLREYDEFFMDDFNNSVIFENTKTMHSFNEVFNRSYVNCTIRPYAGVDEERTKKIQQCGRELILINHGKYESYFIDTRGNEATKCSQSVCDKCEKSKNLLNSYDYSQIGSMKHGYFDRTFLGRAKTFGYLEENSTFCLECKMSVEFGKEAGEYVLDGCIYKTEHQLLDWNQK